MTASVPEQRHHATELARTRGTSRRSRARVNRVRGENGKPYAMRWDEELGRLVDDLPHGEEPTYTNRACRCDPCGLANRAAKARRAKGVAAGAAS